MRLMAIFLVFISFLSSITGQERFMKQYDLINDDFASDVFLLDSIWIVVGFATNFQGVLDNYVLVLNENGEKIDGYNILESQAKALPVLLGDGPKKFIVVNNYNTTNSQGNWDALFLRYDFKNRELLFEEHHGDTVHIENAYRQILSTEGDIISAGWFFNPARDDTLQSNIMLQSIDSLGVFNWQHVYPNPFERNNHFGTGVAEVTGDGFIISGHRKSPISLARSF